MNNFWEKVIACKHENIYPNYYEPIYCGTPYCTGYEVHCKDCGAYISECDCKSNSGISGWSNRRWEIYFEKLHKRMVEIYFTNKEVNSEQFV